MRKQFWLPLFYEMYMYFIHEMVPSLNPGLSECPGGNTEGKFG